MPAEWVHGDLTEWVRFSLHLKVDLQQTTTNRNKSSLSFTFSSSSVFEAPFSARFFLKATLHREPPTCPQDNHTYRRITATVPRLIQAIC